MSNDGRPVPLHTDPPERQFRQVSGELEGALWQLLLRPDVSHTLRVLQLGTVVELLPNVYVQAVRLMYQQPFDRYIRLWCVVPTGAGEIEERTLLNFYTSGFPDPQFTELRPGMDLNLSWWDAVRIRLSELAVELGGAGGVGSAVDAPEAALRELLSSPGADPGATRVAFTRGHQAFPSSATPSTAAQAATPFSMPAGGDAATGDQVRRQAEQVFAETQQVRDGAYAQRDDLERRLKVLYFTRYPAMRDAAKHISELQFAEIIATWVRQGCPTPSAPPPSPEPSTVETTTAGAPNAAGGAAVAPRALTPEEEPPWPLAMELERLQAVITERTRTLEQLCELAGGHFPLPRRAATTGKVQTICARCDAQLSARTPDEREDWLRQ